MNNMRTAVGDDPNAVRADLEAVLNSIIQKTPLLPEVAQRVQERGRRLRQEVFERHGLLDVAVDLIREVRNEE
jgi:hypothetical protein